MNFGGDKHRIGELPQDVGADAARQLVRQQRGLLLQDRDPLFVAADHPCAGEQKVAEFLAERARREKLQVELQKVMPGRSMKAYVVMPNEVVDDPSRLDAWLAEAFDYTATLPPKT